MSASLNDSQLNELFDQLPALAGRERRLEDLDGGLTNRNVKITTSDGVYVARCSGSSSTLLAIDRDNEHFNSRAAERAGVGAPVVDYRPDLGILLIGYLDGITLAKDDFSRPGVIAKVAHACRTLHGGPRFRDDFDMFELQSSYLKIATQNGFRIPEDYLELRGSVRIDPARAGAHAREDGALQQRPARGQLRRGRRQDLADRLRVLRQQRSVLRARKHLAGQPVDARAARRAGHRVLRPPVTRHELARARLQGTVSQYGWTLWGCIQNGGSTLDFDFWEWGMERYENAVEEFRGPDFGRLLDDARTG